MELSLFRDKQLGDVDSAVLICELKEEVNVTLCMTFPLFGINFLSPLHTPTLNSFVSKIVILYYMINGA